MNKWAARWQWLRAFIRDVWRCIRGDNISLVAAAVAFWLFITIVPALLLALSIAASLIDPEVAQQRIVAFSRDLLGPGISQALREQVLAVVRNRGLLTGVALLLGLWTGSQVFLIMEQALNGLLHVERARPFWISRLLAMLMLLVSGVLLLGAMLLVNLIHLLARTTPAFTGLAPWLISLLVPLLLSTATFGLIYHIMPAMHVTWRTALPGACFAGAAWTVFLHLFGLYVANIANYPLLYGSLGGLVLLLFWFYYSALIMLAGAEIAAVLHRRLLAQGDAAELRAEQECEQGGEEDPKAA